MRSAAVVVVLVGVWLALGTSACALFSKADLVQIRYFSPERPRQAPPRVDAGTAPGTSGPAAPLTSRLGRVTSSSSLRERIVYRGAAFELGYYESLRWTERPEEYVRRAFARSLFEEHGIQRALSGDVPTLDIEVIAFDDLRLPTGRAARVQVRVILHTDEGAIFEDTITVDRAVTSHEPAMEDVVAAMSAALDAAAEQVTVRVESALIARRAAQPVTPSE